jgi:hypothetical protein
MAITKDWQAHIEAWQTSRQKQADYYHQPGRLMVWTPRPLRLQNLSF